MKVALSGSPHSGSSAASRTRRSRRASHARAAGPRSRGRQMGDRCPRAQRHDRRRRRRVRARAIVRSWPMRGTLHLLAAEDLKWLLALGAPGVIAGSQQRRAELGSTPGARQSAGCRRARARRRQATGARRADRPVEPRRPRRRAAPRVSRDLVPRATRRGAVQGPDEQFVLVDEWIREHRFFDRHGSASLATIATKRSASWSAATSRPRPGDARRSVALGEAAATRPQDRPRDRGQHLVATAAILRARARRAETAATSCVLLPGFDELVLGYADRTATLDARTRAHRARRQRHVQSDDRRGRPRRRDVEAHRGRARSSSSHSRSASCLPGSPGAVAAYRRFLGKPARLS